MSQFNERPMFSLTIYSLVGVVALAENAVGSGAYKPMAVIKSRSVSMH